MGIENRWYDPHGATNILLMVPVAYSEKLFDKYDDKNVDYFLSFLGALTGVVVNSLACLVFFSILFLLGRPLKVCFYTTLCLAFLTLVFPYSSTNYEGNLNMLFMLSALYFIFSFLKANKSHYLIFSGVFSGLAVNTRDFALIFLFCIIMFVFILTLKQKKFLFYFYSGSFHS